MVVASGLLIEEQIVVLVVGPVSTKAMITVVVDMPAASAAVLVVLVSITAVEEITSAIVPVAACA